MTRRMKNQSCRHSVPQLAQGPRRSKLLKSACAGLLGMGLGDADARLG